MSSFHNDCFYHIYNRGNNKQKIFFTDANYRFFLKKIENEILPHCNVIAYCLMPNHYHLMIYFGSVHLNFRHAINMQNLERKLGTLQSSYTRAINKQEGRVGSLFQAKFKVVEIVDSQQASNCFNYIHRNPLKARLVSDPKLWHFCSFNEYFSGQKGICSRDVAYGSLNVARDSSQFLTQFDLWQRLNEILD